MAYISTADQFGAQRGGKDVAPPTKAGSTSVLDIPGTPAEGLGEGYYTRSRKNSQLRGDSIPQTRRRVINRSRAKTHNDADEFWFHPLNKQLHQLIR